MVGRLCKPTRLYVQTVLVCTYINTLMILHCWSNKRTHAVLLYMALLLVACTGGLQWINLMKLGKLQTLTKN